MFGRSTCRRKKNTKVFFVFLFRALKVKTLSLSLSLFVFRFDSFAVCRPWIFVVWGSIWVRVVLVFEPGYQNAQLCSRIFPNMHTLSFCNITVVNLLWCNVRDKKNSVNIQNYYLCSSIYTIKPKHLTFG